MRRWRQPETAIWVPKTGSTSLKLWDMIEIPTANLWFSTTPSSKKLSSGECESDRQSEMAMLMFWHQSCHFGLSVVVGITWLHFCRLHRRRKCRTCRWNFDAIWHSYRYLIISSFGSHFRLSVIIENLRFAVVLWIMMISFILSEI